MDLGTVRRGSRTSSPNVAAASKPTKLSAAKIAAGHEALEAVRRGGRGERRGGEPVRPPPCPTMISASTRMTATSAVNSTSAARRLARIPSNARNTMARPARGRSATTAPSCRIPWRRCSAGSCR